jgi:hypothetical protein
MYVRVVLYPDGDLAEAIQRILDRSVVANNLIKMRQVRDSLASEVESTLSATRFWGWIDPVSDFYRPWTSRWNSKASKQAHGSCTGLFLAGKAKAERINRCEQGSLQSRQSVRRVYASNREIRLWWCWRAGRWSTVLEKEPREIPLFISRFSPESFTSPVLGSAGKSIFDCFAYCVLG